MPDRLNAPQYGVSDSRESKAGAAMPAERMLSSLSVAALEDLMQRAIAQCVQLQEPTPEIAAALGIVMAEIRFELWLRERHVAPPVSRSTYH
jgi:hypothetical protein